LTLVTAGRVGRAHGLDGSFWVEGADHELPEGEVLTVDGRRLRVERRGGTRDRPLIRLEDVDDPRALRGATLLVDAELEAGEWLAAELVGCAVPGHGAVRRVMDGPSCSLLELEDGVLVPFVSDAVRLVDPDGRRIEVDDAFLGL
jgi:16S rRNA processing protein RimM